MSSNFSTDLPKSILETQIAKKANRGWPVERFLRMSSVASHVVIAAFVSVKLLFWMSLVSLASVWLRFQYMVILFFLVIGFLVTIVFCPFHVQKCMNLFSLRLTVIDEGKMQKLFTVKSHAPVWWTVCYAADLGRLLHHPREVRDATAVGVGRVGQTGASCWVTIAIATFNWLDNR